MEVVVDGVPYAEEAYVRDPIRYLATEYGAKIYQGNEDSCEGYH